MTPYSKAIYIVVRAATTITNIPRWGNGDHFKTLHRSKARDKNGSPYAEGIRKFSKTRRAWTSTDAA